MSFFSKFSDFIDGPVGNALTNLPEDVRRVKRNFKTIGIFDEDPENGYMTRALDDTIKIFQRDNDLKVDGRINPRGETESRIWDVLAGGLEKLDKIAKQPKQKPQNPYVFSLNDQKPETDTTGRMIREKDKSKENEAEDLRTHYLGGSGKPVKEDMNQQPAFLKAMETNRGRFEDSMVNAAIKGKKATKKPHDFHEQIINLKDGESVILNADESPAGGDYWDRDISRYEGAMSGDIKQSLGTGAVKLRSTGSFKATRKGNRVEIEGVVDHSMNDVYNFNEDDPEYFYYREKALNGKAKPFGIHGSKLEYFKGEMEIRNDRVIKHDFKWNPINAADLR